MLPLLLLACAPAIDVGTPDVDTGIDSGLVDTGADRDFQAFGHGDPLGRGEPGLQLHPTAPDRVAITTDRFAMRSDSGGYLGVDVQAYADTTSFLVTAVSSDSGLHVSHIVDPSGATVLSVEHDQGVTGGLRFQYDDQQVNWPSRPTDPPLVPGRYTVVFGVTDDLGYYGERDVDVTLQVKSDPDLAVGTVDVAVLYPGTLGADPTVTGGVEGAVAHWRQIWSAYGLDLTVRYRVATWASPDLDDPSWGSPDYTNFSDDTGPDKDTDILLVVGDDVGFGLNGVAGGVPGTLVASSRAAAVVSWSALAGPDGQFSPAEVELFGETMAHEAGHYLGLFHVVELGYGLFDPIGDTPVCDSQTTCRTALGDNVMYPEPLCTPTECVAQDDLSPEQQGVAHRYTGTL